MSHAQLKVDPISEPPGAKHPEAMDEYLPKHEFSALMIAPRGSGKTTLMLNMITKFYKKYFHRIVVFSPTMHGDGKWETVKAQKGILAKYDDPMEKNSKGLGDKRSHSDIEDGSDSDSDSGAGGGRADGHAPSLYKQSWSSLFAKVTQEPRKAFAPENADEMKEMTKSKSGQSKEGKKFTGKLEKKDIYTDYWEDDLQKVMTESMDHIDKLRKKKMPKHKGKRTLIIFDDLVGSNLFSAKKENPFRRLNATQRHYSISSLMATQAYKEVPKTVRVNATIVILFEIANQQELHTVYEECNVGLKQDEWLQVYKYCTAEPFSFMLINYQKPKGQRIYKGFQEMVAMQPTKEDDRSLIQATATDNDDYPNPKPVSTATPPNKSV